MEEKEFRWRELPGDLPHILQQTVKEWSEDRAATLAAALAYYATFSLVPLLVLVISLVGWIWGRSSTTSRVLAAMGNFLGSSGQNFLQGLILTASQPGNGLFGSIVGTISLIASSLGVFGELQATMNLIWEIQPKPVKGFWRKVSSVVLDHLLSFGVVLSLGVLLMLSIAASTAFSWFGSQFGYLLPMSNNLLQLGNLLISYLLITFLLAMIFKFLPDVEIDWKALWLGAGITALLFLAGKFLISLYIGQVHPGSKFGAAGTLVLVLLWVYYSAQILFFGAELTQVTAKLYGLRMHSDSRAEPILEETPADFSSSMRSLRVPVKDLIEDKAKKQFEEKGEKASAGRQPQPSSDILNARRRTWKQSLTFLAPILGGVILAIARPLYHTLIKEK